jgi:hypothetical protein
MEVSRAARVPFSRDGYYSQEAKANYESNASLFLSAPLRNLIPVEFGRNCSRYVRYKSCIPPYVELLLTVCSIDSDTKAYPRDQNHHVPDRR